MCSYMWNKCDKICDAICIYVWNECDIMCENVWQESDEIFDKLCLYVWNKVMKGVWWNMYMHEKNMLYVWWNMLRYRMDQKSVSRRYPIEWRQRYRIGWYKKYGRNIILHGIPAIQYDECSGRTFLKGGRFVTPRS